MRRSSTLGAFAAFAGLGAVLSACGPGASPSDPAVLFSREEPRFELRLDELPLDVTGVRQLRARLAPRGAWHVSTAYPVKLELEGERLRLAQARYTRDEAFELSERGVEFRMDFEPDSDAPGRVAGTLHFGICLASELCEPVEEAFSAEIP